jgi:pimeloyl-ACP methyl ester carboxylesterase
LMLKNDCWIDIACRVRLNGGNLKDLKRRQGMKKLIMILPLVFFLSLTFSCQTGDEVAAEKESEPTIIIDNAISVDGVSIAYEVRGKGKPALVFVHGWCCDRSYWKAQLPHFADKYKVVAIDLAGHGESGLDRKEWTIGAFGQDVAAVVGKLDLEQVVLVGHSMGGSVILEASRLIPDRVIGLVGVDTLNDFEQKISQRQMEKWLSAYNSNFDETFKKFAPNWFFTDDSDPMLVDRIVTDMSSTLPAIGIGVLEGSFNFQNNEIIRVLEDLKVPITCINSDMSPTNVESNQRYAPSFKVKLTPGVGHFNMIEAPEEFNRLLEETIQEFVQMAEEK